MVPNFGRHIVRIAALAGATVLGASPALAAPPVCHSLVIGPIPGYANSTIQVSEGMVLYNCYEPDGDTMHVTSPYVPYTIYVQPNGQAETRVHTVSDGKGGTTTQTIYVTRN